MKSVFLHTFVIILTIFTTGCGGFGLGPGGDMGMIPSAVDVENPARKGTIQGQIDVAPGFVPLFLQYLGTSSKEGFSSQYKNVKVSIIGANGQWSSSLNEKGQFKFPPIYSGRYVLKVSYFDHLLFYHDIVLLDEAEFDLKATIVGYDLADINNNDDKFELLYELEARHSEKEVEYFRIISPDGSEKTVLPDGTREFSRNGVVRILNNDGRIEYRRDFDNDLVPDDMDFDDDNDGISDSRDKDLGNNGVPDRFEKRKLSHKPVKDFITGNAAVPVITKAFAVIPGDNKRPLADITRGDVIHFSAHTQDGGGPPVIDMEVRIYSFGRPVFSFKLHDDGSESDLLATWPGSQVSGDLVKGDGVFSSIIPVDSATITALNNSLLLFTGKNSSGEDTNSYILPMSVSVADKQEESPAGSNNLSFAVSNCGLYRTIDDELTARLSVDGSVIEHLTARLITPSDETKLLSLADRKGSVFTLSSSKLKIEKGLYILVAKSSTGGVFYAGFPAGE